MSFRANQTREMDVLVQFFRRLENAYAGWDYAPVEALIDGDAVLRTRSGEVKGVDAIIRHLKALGRTGVKFAIVAPKGGLVTVNVLDASAESVRPQEREQVYRVYRDKIVEVTDLGRSPEMVYRPRSQPN